MYNELFNAAEKGNLNEVKRLIQEGCEIEIANNSLLLIAAIHNKLNVFRFLIQCGVKLELSSKLPQHLTSEQPPNLLPSQNQSNQINPQRLRKRSLF